MIGLERNINLNQEHINDFLFLKCQLFRLGQPFFSTYLVQCLSPIWERNSIQNFSQTKTKKEQKNVTTGNLESGSIRHEQFDFDWQQNHALWLKKNFNVVEKTGNIAGENVFTKFFFLKKFLFSITKIASFACKYGNMPYFCPLDLGLVTVRINIGA